MGQWVSSKEFAKTHKISYAALKMSCIRASKGGKNFCSTSSYILHFNYSNGIGRGGKVLRIWSEPFATQAEAE